MSAENLSKKPATEELTAAEHTRGDLYYRPQVDILEQGDELLVLADVPGPPARTLTFSSRTARWPSTPGCGRVRETCTSVRSRSTASAISYRTFQISEAIDAGKISAASPTACSRCTFLRPKRSSLARSPSWGAED